MSNSKFKLTGENTNLARVAQMILGPCTNVLRDVLRKKISPPDLEKKVKAYVADTKKPLINKQQEALVYGKDYSKFDVTLLYFLLRNMCSIQPHSNKWGNNPRKGDRSVSANIERVRLIRNDYGHNSETSISDTDFNIKYQDMKDIVQELEKYLGSSTKYQDEVKELETCPMDPTQSEKNIKELLDLHEKIKDISGDVTKMKNKVLPWNIQVVYEKDILKWKEDDTYFVETHNFQAMLDKVRQQPFVMFVGVPGSGKTATARHIALLLQEKDGYEILPTKDIKDIETYCDPHNLQAFVIDDVLGVFGFDMKELEKLAMYKDRLNEPTMPGTKILMTCREVVFKHEAFSGSFLSNKKHVVQLHSKENALNDQDKYDLFAKYNLDKNFLSADTFSNTSKSFPYLCKLLSRKEELRHYGQQFFISPVPCILKVLDNMKIRNKVHYASLVLLMTNQNTLSEEDFNNENTEYFDEMKAQVLKKCKVDSTTGSFNFIDSLNEMVGTYTEQCQIGFKFVHDSMYEIVAYHFGRQYPELILQYMDSDYIANYIKLEKYKCRKRKREEDKLEQTVVAKKNCNILGGEKKVHDLCIILHESHYNLLAERLFKDVQKCEFSNVFKNKALKHSLVMQKFLDVMKSKPYSELFTVFLSTLEEEKVKPANRDKKSIFWSNHYLRRNLRWIDELEYRCARAIHCVIFYGHGHILQFIIDQIIKETKTVNDLFQTPFNIRSGEFCTTVEGTNCNKRNESGINENSTRRCDVSDDESWSDLCSEMESLETNLGTEDVLVEQLRLLNLGCHSGDLLTVQTLLEHVDKDVLNSRSLEIAGATKHFNIHRELLKHMADVNITDKFDSPLITACSNGHVDIVVELLKHGADVNFNSGYISPLIAACSNGHVDIVDELLKHGADVNFTSGYISPLIAACSNGHVDIVVELLKHGADVNITSGYISPLIAACSDGHVDIVVELLKHGADVNITVSNKSPLIAACSLSYFDHRRCLLRHCQNINTTDFDDLSAYAACSKIHLDMVRELLKYKANVNIKNEKTSPLIAVCLNKNIDIATVQELLKHGADVNLTATDRSPLIAACLQARLDVVLELLKYGADVNLIVTHKSPLIAACLQARLDVVLELLKHGADVNLTVADMSPLIAACLKARLDVVMELLKHGADVNLTVTDMSPLIAACFQARLDVVLELLKHEADVNPAAIEISPLIAACLNGHLIIVNELLKNGATANATLEISSPHIHAIYSRHVYELFKYKANGRMKIDNVSPLIIACSKGDLDIVTELVKHGADVNLTVTDMSPLIAACLKARLDVVLELLKHGADVNLTVTDMSPLIIACSKGYIDIVTELVKHGADVNLTVSCESPLLAACSEGHSNIVQELFKYGADVNITVSDRSPLLAACSRGHLNIVQELFKYGADANIAVSDDSPLIAACSKGYLDVIYELMKHEADVNITVSDKSPLIAACSNGYLDIISLLLKHGADINITVSGNSPLTAACLMKFDPFNKAAYAKTISDDTLFRLSRSKVHLVIIRKLLKHGADVNGKNCKDSPLNASCLQGDLNIVHELLKHGADANIVVNNDSPLITACANWNFDIVDELLTHGAHVNITVSDKSPLIVACSEGHLDIVIKLLNNGADVNIRVSDKSPLIAACSEGHLDIVLELLKRGAMSI